MFKVISYSIFLGVLQGATEFLPVSSSAHLALFEAFFDLKEAGLAFDVALHMGTLVAILIYFRDDILRMIQALLTYGDKGAEAVKQRRLAMFICLATIPGVFAGVFLEKASESYLRNPLLIATMLAAVALLLLWAEKAGKRLRHFDDIKLADALTIGMAQGLAIVPGTSRSGITMTAGLFLGLNRPAAARFSFLLAAPIIGGAGVYKIPDMISQGVIGAHAASYGAGFLAAAVSGYLFIAFLLNFIRTRTFAIFVYYRLGLAALVALAYFGGYFVTGLSYNG